jgi:hypothetical protein
VPAYELFLIAAIVCWGKTSPAKYNSSYFLDWFYLLNPDSLLLFKVWNIKLPSTIFSFFFPRYICSMPEHWFPTILFSVMRVFMWISCLLSPSDTEFHIWYMFEDPLQIVQMSDFPSQIFCVDGFSPVIEFSSKVPADSLCPQCVSTQISTNI